MGRAAKGRLGAPATSITRPRGPGARAVRGARPRPVSIRVPAGPACYIAPMRNEFYGDFDLETTEPRSADYRTPFQRDRDRLIHTAAFRRLQGKTQVFLSGEYDFYRTRLTHSIEVAQVAGSIARYLNHTDERLDDGFRIDTDLVEAVALAHDIGHPPFGHAGEATLNRIMQPYGGFEGNAQTLRLVAETIYGSGERRAGLSPTRALLDGIMKYKVLFGELPAADRRRQFLYDDQLRWRDHVFGGRTPPPGLAGAKALNACRSLECEIMDWADDVAYSVNDVVDGVHAGFVTVERVERWAAGADLAGGDRAHVEELLAAIRQRRLDRDFNRKIGALLTAVRLVERDGFLADLTSRHRFGLEIDPAARREQTLYKRLAIDLVFRSPQVCQLEHKGRTMLERIFATWKRQYLEGGQPDLVLVSDQVERLVRGADLDATARARLLCDYLSGMTDGFAARIYKRLFDPDFGSIVDLI